MYSITLKVYSTSSHERGIDMGFHTENYQN